MKLYIEETLPRPWETWDKDLWKASQRLKDMDFEITSIREDAHAIMLEYYHGLDYQYNSRQIYVVYINSLESNQVEEFTSKWFAIRDNVILLSDSVAVMDLFDGSDTFTCQRWNKPSRVDGHFVYTDHLDTTSKTGGFAITCNGQRPQDNLTEVLRTYFAMCLKDDPDHEGELELMQDVDIFSAQELPFETFNNVYFHGLQPNPKMFKTIKNSRLFISPYRGPSVPINAIDAWMLGTPAIVRDTEVNRSVFNWTDKCFYKDEQELARKIKFFSEIPVDDPAYIRMVDDGFNAVKGTHYVTNSLLELIYILQG